MKRPLIIFWVLILLLGLCSCANIDTPDTTPTDSIQTTLGKTELVADDTTQTTPSTSVTPTETPTTAPATEPPHTHTFKAATCITPKTCSCGETEGAATGHSWEAATYTAPKKCSVCGTTEGNPLDVPGKENYHGHVYTGGNSSKKYHYEANCPGKNSHEITWEEVQRRNLGPCGTCVLK